MKAAVEISDVTFQKGELSFRFALPPRAMKNFAASMVRDGYLPESKVSDDDAIAEAVARAFADHLIDRLCR
jgi:hypothetical protein